MQDITALKNKLSEYRYLIEKAIRERDYVKIQTYKQKMDEVRIEIRRRTLNHGG